MVSIASSIAIVSIASGVGTVSIVSTLTVSSLSTASQKEAYIVSIVSTVITVNKCT